VLNNTNRLFLILFICICYKSKKSIEFISYVPSLCLLPENQIHLLKRKCVNLTNYRSI